MALGKCACVLVLTLVAAAQAKIWQSRLFRCSLSSAETHALVCLGCRRLITNLFERSCTNSHSSDNMILESRESYDIRPFVTGFGDTPGV